MENIQQQINEWAIRRRDALARAEVLQQQIARNNAAIDQLLETLGVLRIEEEYNTLLSRAEDEKQDLRAALLDHVQAGGTLDGVVGAVARKQVRLVYDENDAVDHCVDHAMHHLLQVRKKDFKAYLEGAGSDWPGAEAVTDVVIVLSDKAAASAVLDDMLAEGTDKSTPDVQG